MSIFAQWELKVKELLMAKSNINIFRKLNQQIISILMIIVLPLVSALCEFENTAHAQFPPKIVALPHIDGDSHFDDLSGQPPHSHGSTQSHSHGSTQNDGNGALCCDQLTTIHSVNTFSGLSVLSLQLVMSSSAIYSYIDKSDVELNQSLKEYLTIHNPSDLVPKEDSYYLAFPSHAPPLSS